MVNSGFGSELRRVKVGLSWICHIESVAGIFFKAVPEFVISCGRKYKGHPHADSSGKLSRYGNSVYRSDEQGNRRSFFSMKLLPGVQDPCNDYTVMEKTAGQRRGEWIYS